MPSRIIRSLVAASLALGACASDGGGAATLVVQNRSNFTIVDLRVASADDPSFGANLLGGETLNPGDQLALGVSCGVFDARVIDETGAECDLSAVDLCANHALWEITNETCPVFAANGSARGGQETP